MKKFLLSLAFLAMLLAGFTATARADGPENAGPIAQQADGDSAARGPGNNLVIGGVPMAETGRNYLAVIKFLTVAPARQQSAVFKGNNTAAIKALEDPLRRQIFDAMNNNQSERFAFANMRAAQENFAMRVEAVNFMVLVHKGRNGGGVDFGYYGGNSPAQADSRHWVKSNQFNFATRPGVRAADAIDGMVSQRFRGECLGCLEVTVLQAARKALGADRFNRMHASGLRVAGGNSVNPHIRSAVRISVRDMVPGDWVYMKNQDDYNTDLKAGTPRGYWSGENAVYMGRYVTTANKVPVYQANAPQRFSGMGVYDATERAELHGSIKKGYLDLMRAPFTFRTHRLVDSNIRFTQVHRLVVGG